VTLEEIENAENLVLNLEKLALPNQLVAVLADPLLQKLLQLRPGEESSARVNNWIAACISDAASGDAAGGELLELLNVVHDYVSISKVQLCYCSPCHTALADSAQQAPPSMFQSLVREIFKTWNGVDRRDLVLETLAYVPLSDFDGKKPSPLRYGHRLDTS